MSEVLRVSLRAWAIVVVGVVVGGPRPSRFTPLGGSNLDTGTASPAIRRAISHPPNLGRFTTTVPSERRKKPQCPRSSRSTDLVAFWFTAPTFPVQPRPVAINAVLFSGWVAFMLLLANKSVVYGSRAGNWVYGYNALELNGKLLVQALLWTAGIGVAYWLSDKVVERFKWLVIAGWIALAFTFHIHARSLYPATLATILKHDGCTSFYTAAKNTTPYELLSNFDQVAPTLPLHAKTNMPGKTLMFDAALTLYKDATKAARVLVAFSALGGLLVFAVAERWLRNRRAALLALVLYLVLPSKLNFFPQPNTVTPVFVFLSLWLLLAYLDELQTFLLFLLGLSLYVLLIYEPLPFVLGLLFVGAIAQRLADGRFPWRSLWKIALYPGLGFLGAYVAMKLSFGFDAFSAFQYMYEDAVHFNQRDNRPYDVWVVQNVVEFSIGLGIVSAMVVALGWFQTASDVWQTSRREGVARAVRSAFAAPATNMLICLFATLLIVDAWGVNRGEITRLWIFMAAAFEMAVAAYCFERFDASTGRLLAAACAMQAFVSTVIVGFMNC